MNTFVSPSPLSTPRPAAGAALPGWLARARAFIARSRQGAALARDRRALYALADRYSVSQPELSKDLRSAAGRDDGRV